MFNLKLNHTDPADIARVKHDVASALADLRERLIQEEIGEAPLLLCATMTGLLWFIWAPLPRESTASAAQLITLSVTAEACELLILAGNLVDGIVAQLTDRHAGRALADHLAPKIPTLGELQILAEALGDQADEVAEVKRIASSCRPVIRTEGNPNGRVIARMDKVITHVGWNRRYTPDENHARAARRLLHLLNQAGAFDLAMGCMHDDDRSCVFVLVPREIRE